MDVEARVTELMAAGQHREAATEIIRGHGPRILGYLHKLLGNDADASDAFSLFAEQVWRGVPRFEGRSTSRTWAFKAAWSAAMKVRDDGWRRLHQRLESSEASRLADEVRTRTGLRVERQRRELEELRAELSDEDQTLLVLRLDQQLAWEDVAEVLSTDTAPVDPATLRKRYERIKARLAALVKERHGDG
ncbi:MAG: sigma-70 family RNA polymerase sigma factor [Anaeromyxobacter sp.]